MKNVHMLYRNDRKKTENLKKKANEDYHLNFQLHNTLCLPEGVHKI